MLKMSILDMSLNINNLRLQMHLPEANELTSSPPSATYMRQLTGSASVQVMAYYLFGTKALPEAVLTYCQLDI